MEPGLNGTENSGVWAARRSLLPLHYYDTNDFYRGTRGECTEAFNRVVIFISGTTRDLITEMQRNCNAAPTFCQSLQHAELILSLTGLSCPVKLVQM